MQRSAPPFRFKRRRPRNAEQLRAWARMSGLVNKEELIISFHNSVVFVLRGVAKGRIGRVIGIGAMDATVVFDGSPDKHRVKLTDAMNV